MPPVPRTRSIRNFPAIVWPGAKPDGKVVSSRGVIRYRRRAYQGDARPRTKSVIHARVVTWERPRT